MSDALVWQIIKNNNSFLVKRGGGGPKGGNASRAGTVQFSCEPGNVLGVNTFKFSGLANSKAVDIAKSGNNLSITAKAYKQANKVKKSVASTPLKKSSKHSLKVINARVNSFATKLYRADLSSAAASKFKKLHSVVRVEKKIIKGAKSKTGRN